ncbi:unnamed protein product [Spirodela intermedia]|uniref:Uncharacterized protein n=1 Tax=Spirodela intermedia TaxID=51605 RepID=A0A7I8JPS0_SPIIN|nr:unnamed protein product [Spirodela intermedia]CAA6672146.1 unnamed protein product [Spirodela intermedia]
MENPVKKKDRHVMSILFSTISDEVSCELDVEKMAKQMWNLLKAKNIKSPRLRSVIILSKGRRKLFSHEPWGRTSRKPHMWKSQ